MTLPQALTALITAQRVEKVPADRASALVRLARAREKLDGARRITAIDVEVAKPRSTDDHGGVSVP